ncbi:MAG: hypothetical protein LBH43_02515 [Treponema sp.]|jgi:nitrogen regulatory protein PII|nr:hypothetical protein [Treponema sp.]
MTKKNLLSKLFFKIPGTQQGVASVKKSLPAIPNLKMVFFIVDWHHTNIVSDVFEEEKVRFYFINKGRGNPSSEVLDLFGIGTDEIALVTCLEQEVGVQVLIKEVQKKLMHKSPIAWLAFSVPLSAINDPVLLVFKQSIHKSTKISEELDLRVRTNIHSKDKGENMANAKTHDLIISVVNQGYSDEFMNTAREAGASGGTVLNARGQAHEGAVKFFGISVQEEKEIILILSPNEKKENIMKAVCEAHGLNSKAHGIVFSLPVDNVMGLSFE